MARRQVSIFINGREVANQIKDITAEKRKVVRELNKMTVGSKEYNAKVKELQRLNGVINNHRQQLRGVESTWSKVKAGVGKFAAVAGVAFGAEVIIDYGKKLFNLGTEMELLTRKAETVFGEALPQVTEAARANANAMGLTVSQYTDASAAIADLLIPMKFTREEAAQISTGLVDLSGALAEWSGGQVSAAEVTDILGKAMLGEREQLKSLGISINEADVKARLAEKGLSGLTGEMLQQAKAAATLELITEKSADAQAAFANNSDTSARKQAALSAKLTDVTEKIATALIPVFSRLLDAVIPVVDVIGDVTDALTTTEETSKTTGKGVQAIADNFKVLGSVIKTVWNVIAAVGNFLTGDWPAALLRGEIAVKSLANTVLGSANQIKGLLGFEKFELLDTSEAEKKLDLLKEKTDEVVADVVEKRDALDADAARRRAADAEKAAAAAKKKYEAVQKETEKGEQKLRDIVKNLREQARLEELSENDRKLEELRATYQKEIDLAAELAAKGSTEALAQKAALERLQSEALIKLKGELAAAEFDAEMLLLDEQEQARLAAEEVRRSEREAAETAIDEFTQTELLSERQRAIDELNEYYLEVGGMATAAGLETEEIHAAHRRRLAAINKDFDEKDKAELVKSQAEQAQVLRESFSSLATTVSGAFKEIGGESKEFVALQKTLTLVQIGIDTASAISSLTRNSSANPANAVTGGIAGAVQFATGLAQILANIAKARAILTQKRDGGYLDVTGADDNVNYRARYIGSPGSGMLPDSPVVLASERGREYFVSNRDLQNPVVANYVRMIDNISRNRTPQFMEGGFTSGTAETVTAPSSDGKMYAEMLQMMARLDQTLRNGIYARVEDDTIVDIRERFGELQDASGGVLP